MLRWFQRRIFRPLPEAAPAEIESLRRSITAAHRRAARPAVLLEASEDDPGNWRGSLIGAVRAGEAGESWPVHNGLPMLPLLQLGLPELVWRPEGLADAGLVTVWCAEMRTPRFPGKLQTEFLTMAMKDEPRAVQAFVDAHRETITIDREIDADFIVVRAVHRGRPLERLNDPNSEPLFRAATITARLVDDHPGMADRIELDFMPSVERDHAETMYDRRVILDRWFDGLAALTPNHEATKLGGWPTPIQGQPDFGPNAEFILQIASDSARNIRILDDGVIHIARDRVSGAWSSQWVCY